MERISKILIIVSILLSLIISPSLGFADTSSDDAEIETIELSFNPFSFIKSFFEKIFFRSKSEFDFDIDVDPAIATIKQGGTAKAYVKVTPVKGDRENVDLTITNWNSQGVTSSFETTSTKTGSWLYITASCKTPPDGYLHTVQGASGIRTSVDSINVIVEENTEDCTEPTTTTAPTTSAPTVSDVKPSISSTSATCTESAITFTGSASGPVGTYVTKVFSFEMECDAWGSPCYRDSGEPESTNWKQSRQGGSVGGKMTVHMRLCTEVPGGGCEYNEKVTYVAECPMHEY